VEEKQQSEEKVDQRSAPNKGVPGDRGRRVAIHVSNLVEPICASQGIELVHVEYQRETRGRILRLYIDRPEGVTLDDCVGISRQVSDALDVLLESEGPYHLEVSSPGANRPIGKPSDFLRFQGRRAEIRTIHPIIGRNRFRGILDGMAADDVILKHENDVVRIPLQNVARARLIT